MYQILFIHDKFHSTLGFLKYTEFRDTYSLYYEQTTFATFASQ